MHCKCNCSRARFNAKLHVEKCMYVRIHACMYACMHVCMYACMRVCVYAWMHGWMQGCVVCGSMDACRWMDGWMQGCGRAGGWVGGSMDACRMCACIRARPRVLARPPFARPSLFALRPHAHMHACMHACIYVRIGRSSGSTISTCQVELYNQDKESFFVKCDGLLTRTRSSRSGQAVHL